MHKKAKHETLPTWDLGDLYPAIDAPKISQDTDALRTQAQEFAACYSAKMAKISAAELAEAITRYEAMQDIMGRLGSYAQLIYASDMTNGAYAQFYQNIHETLTVIGSELLFFPLAINRIEEKQLQKMLADDAKLAHYAPWLRDVRATKPYQLSDELEKLLLEKSVTGHSAWCRLFDETIAQMRFPYDGEKLSSAQIMDLLSSKDGSVRKEAAKIIGRQFEKHAHVFTLITNTLAKDKDVEDSWRGYKAPISARNVSNQVEDEVVETLLATVRENYGRTSHRYYQLKAGWLGGEKLDYWDRNAPLPQDDDAHYTWDEAVELVLGAYEAFSPELARIGKGFFEKNWIDAPVRPGKSPGAFAHPTVPSAHPYLLVNFQGKTRDVMTLAHELGHGVHQVLSAQQGALMADTPLTLAETASVFGEQLVFQEILCREKSAKRKRILIASKVEDMLNTVVRQVAFCSYEQRVHAARKNGELTTDEIADIWLDVQRESLGPALRFKKPYRYYWCYIPHFIHSAFYVYAYAFGDCLVNALYGVYQSEQTAGRGADFEQRYLQMLKAGGTLRHKELLAPFGLDIAKPDFWQQGLNIIAGYIDQLEHA